ncbi:hypothetical protein [Burkholderia stagnalis]|nr:hypothetical protein [Burkholderia stagnalis]
MFFVEMTKWRGNGPCAGLGWALAHRVSKIGEEGKKDAPDAARDG